MEWTRGHIIGHGATAAVSAATSRKSGEIIAVKSAELQRSKALQREAEILSGLDCPYIIGFRGCDVTREGDTAVFNLKMEYAPGGTVADAARRLGGVDGPTARRYTCQIVKGLKYLHSKGIVHCDLKGSNILICDGGVKIADLGCAKAAGAAAIGGTPMYMAPEVARGEDQGFPSDVWSLGCTLIQMSTGKSPWPDAAAATVRRIAFSGEVPEFPEAVSELCKDFLSKCLRVVPAERWTATELLRHPFLEESESPTSVLDRSVWAGGESCEDSVHMDGEYSSESAMQRMKELGKISGDEKWEWGHSWITVREVNFVNSEKWTQELLTLDNFQFL
ncbi:mitogen-activated protein kinase kinase kinase 18-like [Andrographis paniculata]|uniref:mitogen-activated protein kinase kinase kinase 18-like n=1 Tax=Andrographis paniculata TaxID=175694 RepID=UPI0021E7A30D|nr:mitogen-activated protein kinase kinase kinase 18-like [Andrographis paniculata]